MSEDVTFKNNIFPLCVAKLDIIQAAVARWVHNELRITKDNFSFSKYAA